jgi:hypothetical protein
MLIIPGLYPFGGAVIWFFLDTISSGALSRAISKLIGEFFSGNWPFVDPFKTASFSNPKYSPVEATGQNNHCLNR